MPYFVTVSPVTLVTEPSVTTAIIEGGTFTDVPNNDEIHGRRNARWVSIADTLDSVDETIERVDGLEGEVGRLNRLSGITFKNDASGTSDENMVAGRIDGEVVITHTAGNVYSTGNTLWEVLVDNAISLTQFKPISNVFLSDFGQDYGVYPTIIDANTFHYWDDYCYENSLILEFTSGQYCVNYTVQKKARWYYAGTPPKLAPFPLNDDDKVYLRPGYKTSLPGASIVGMTGTYSRRSTQRSDLFSDVTPIVQCQTRLPSDFKNIAVVMDMDVLDSGGTLTLPAADNRASGMDCGVLFDDNGACNIDNLVVFGYFDRAGICIWSHGQGDNPDYNKFYGGSTMGYYGLALIGNDATDGPGLSGSQFVNYQLFGNDHHNLERLPQTLTSEQSAGIYPNAYGHVLFIDGQTPAINADMNGHEFINGGLRTYSNAPIVVDHASNIHFVNVPLEFSEVSGQPDTTGTQFKATENTRNFNMMNSRNNDVAFWNHTDFGGIIKELNITSDNYGGSWWGNEGNFVGLLSTGGGGEPRLLFTDNPASSVNNYMLIRNDDKLEYRVNGAFVGGFELNGLPLLGQLHTVTPVAGVLDITGLGSYIQVLETDDIDTILPVVGHTKIMIKGGGNGSFTLKNETGNIRTVDDSDRIVQNQFDYVELVCNSAQWVVING